MIVNPRALLACFFALSRAVDLFEGDLTVLLYEIYRNDTFAAYGKYPLEIFSPLTGPHFRRLAQLSEKEARHMAENGFPSGEVLPKTFPVYLPLERNKVFIYNVSLCRFFRIRSYRHDIYILSQQRCRLRWNDCLRAVSDGCFRIKRVCSSGLVEWANVYNTNNKYIPSSNVLQSIDRFQVQRRASDSGLS